MAIRAIKNRIKIMRDTLDSIEKAVENGDMILARNLAEGIDRQSDDLWKSLWKVKKEAIKLLEKQREVLDGTHN